MFCQVQPLLCFCLLQWLQLKFIPLISNLRFELQNLLESPWSCQLICGLLAYTSCSWPWPHILWFALTTHPGVCVDHTNYDLPWPYMLWFALTIRTLVTLPFASLVWLFKCFEMPYMRSGLFGLVTAFGWCCFALASLTWKPMFCRWVPFRWVDQQ